MDKNLEILAYPLLIDVYNKVINIYGVKQQFIIAMEELAELIQNLSKYLRYGNTEKVISNIVNEIVDCEIMIDQIKIIINQDKDKYQSVFRTKSLRIREIVKK